MEHESIVSFSFESGVAPVKVKILPLDEIIKTNDGREFRLENPAFVMKNSFKQNIDMLVDYEHDSTKEEGSFRSIAAGWIKKMSIGSDGLYADIEWTAKAKELIRNKEYRYLSPTLGTVNGEIKKIISVGLVNQPALPLVATCSQKKQLTDNSDTDSLISAIKEKLGLNDGVTTEMVIEGLSYVEENCSLDVKAAMKDCVFPRAMEEELLEIRKNFGKGRFKVFVEKLSAAGFGYPDIYIQQTSGMKFNVRNENCSISKEEKDVCTLAGISEEQYMNKKGEIE